MPENELLSGKFMNAEPITIVDCHLHFLDSEVHSYPIFRERSAAFEALVGDYSALPRRYLPKDYLAQTSRFKVVKTIWAEFMSDDPLREVRWAEALSNENSHPHGLIAQANFLSPEITGMIDSYGSSPRVRAVRQHLAFHPRVDLKVARPNTLADPVWRERLSLLSKYALRCEMEILAPDLPEFAAAAKLYPSMQFILPLMGWPIDLTDAGRRAWQRDMRALSRCKNVAVKVFGMECIFGLNWTVGQVRPWISDTIDFFGPERCMFASHMPIAGLARSFDELYAAYFDVVSHHSKSEKQKLFHDTATKIYGV